MAFSVAVFQNLLFLKWPESWWLEVQSIGAYLLCWVFYKMFWPWDVQPRALLYPSIILILSKFKHLDNKEKE